MSTPSPWPSLAALLLVLALIPAAMWLLRRLQSARAGRPGAIELVAGLPLGPRERIAVVNVGGRSLVLGVTAQQITHLATLDEPLEAPSAAAGTHSVPPAIAPFARVLAERLRRQSPPRD